MKTAGAASGRRPGALARPGRDPADRERRRLVYEPACCTARARRTRTGPAGRSSSTTTATRARSGSWTGWTRPRCAEPQPASLSAARTSAVPRPSTRTTLSRDRSPRTTVTRPRATLARLGDELAQRGVGLTVDRGGGDGDAQDAVALVDDGVAPGPRLQADGELGVGHRPSVAPPGAGRGGGAVAGSAACASSSSPRPRPRRSGSPGCWRRWGTGCRPSWPSGRRPGRYGPGYPGALHDAAPDGDLLFVRSGARLGAILGAYAPDLALCASFPARDTRRRARGPAARDPQRASRAAAALPQTNPLGWALRNDDGVLGMTLHRMTREFDAGPVYAQAAVSVADDEDPAADGLQRFAGLSAQLLARALERLEAGDPGDPRGRAAGQLAVGPVRDRRNAFNFP